MGKGVLTREPRLLQHPSGFTELTELSFFPDPRYHLQAELVTDDFLSTGSSQSFGILRLIAGEPRSGVWWGFSISFTLTVPLLSVVD